MALTSLLVCADAEAVQVLTRVIQDLGMEVDSCRDPHSAQNLLRARAFDAIIVDCIDRDAASQLIHSIRNEPVNRSTVIVVLVSQNNQVNEIFAQGANFALYKPVSEERATHSIRAARGLIRQERRVQPRIPVAASTSLAYPGQEQASGTLIDLNESGMGLEAQDRLPPRCRVYFQFALPGNSPVIRLAGEVMWQDSYRRVGIRFVQVPQASRKLLQTWVEAGRASQSAESSAPAPDGGEVSLGLSAGLGLLSVSAADRRRISRQACHLGADVYRMGSDVPLRCSLGDIGSGGCYVETTDTVPVGSVLEIVVRTEGMKLTIAGTVQSTHPGFGMGVKFNLRNDEQRNQVQQLIDCAKTEPKLIE